MTSSALPFRLQLLLVFLLATTASSQAFPDKFVLDYKLQCFDRYSWVRSYLASCLEQAHSQVETTPTRKYAIFIFDDEQRKARIGGLGDRWAGLVSTFFWALRTNRTFLIQDNYGLLSAYLHCQTRILCSTSFLISLWMLVTIHTSINGQIGVGQDFKNEQIITTLLTTINTVSIHAAECALDGDNPGLDHFSIVRMRTNRAYLCRWAENVKSAAYTELKQQLHYNHSADDLYAWAGCALRSVLWPTNKLWKEVDKLFDNNNHHHHSSSNDHNGKRIAVHFRCGDHAYDKTQPNLTTDTCIVQSGRAWQGVSPLEEVSLASPVDIGNCAVNHLKHLKSHQSVNATLSSLIASNSDNAAQQIASTASWSLTAMTVAGCQMDRDRSKECARYSLLTWFAMASSDKFILQSHLDPNVGEPWLLSSFSRTAAWYSLRSSQDIILAENCTRWGSRMSAKTKLGRLSQGNWLCGIGDIY